MSKKTPTKYMRPGEAFKFLRHQPCFRKATNLDIRCSLRKKKTGQVFYRHRSTRSGVYSYGAEGGYLEKELFAVEKNEWLVRGKRFDDHDLAKAAARLRFRCPLCQSNKNPFKTPSKKCFTWIFSFSGVYICSLCQKSRLKSAIKRAEADLATVIRQLETGDNNARHVRTAQIVHE